MPNSQNKNGKAQVVSEKTDDQIISDLIENRKHQMEALIKIMTSMDDNQTVSDASVQKENTLKAIKKKIIKGRTSKKNL